MNSGFPRLRVQQVNTQSSALSLRLLEVPFEPATALAGEEFDRLCEHLARQLERSDNTRPAGGEYQPEYFSRPRPTGAQLQVSLMQLRDEIVAGRFPGNRISLRRASSILADVARDAQAVAVSHPLGLALNELTRAVSRYSTAMARLRERLVRAPGDRASVAQAALNTERALLQDLDDVAAHFTSRMPR